MVRVRQVTHLEVHIYSFVTKPHQQNWDLLPILQANILKIYFNRQPNTQITNNEEHFTRCIVVKKLEDSQENWFKDPCLYLGTENMQLQPTDSLV